MVVAQGRPHADMLPSLPFPRVRDDDDLLYQLEVLRLNDGETEASLNDRYLHEAADLGLELPPDAELLRKTHMSTADSALTVASTHLSSDFTASRASISTGLTSRSSTEHRYLLVGPQSPTTSRNDSLFSLPSFEEYDALLDLISVGTANGSSSSLSYPPQAPPASPVHSGSARMSFNVKRNIRRISGLRRGKGASSSRSCTTCRNDLKLSSAICTLPCSHSYCRDCLRHLVLQAIDDESRLPPRCCLNPVPGVMVKMVLTEVEQPLLMAAMHRNLSRWQGQESLPSLIEPALLDLGQPEASVGSSPNSSVARSCSSAEANQRSLENKQLLSFRDEQIEERDRFVHFQRNQRQHLVTRQKQIKSEIQTRHVATGLELEEQHLVKATNLEDRHVSGEMELRNTLEQQYKSCLVRLKHMEAYCYGQAAKVSGGSNRVVTDRDLRELRQQYKVRDDMERLHEAKINVLRERQAKQLEVLIAKQEDEYGGVLERNKKELDDLSKAFEDEKAEFGKVFASRKQALMARWAIAEEILRKKLEEKDHLEYGPLPAIEFPESMEDFDDAEVSNGTDQSMTGSSDTPGQTQTPTPSEPRFNLETVSQHVSDRDHVDTLDATPRARAELHA